MSNMSQRKGEMKEVTLPHVRVGSLYFYRPPNRWSIVVTHIEVHAALTIVPNDAHNRSIAGFGDLALVVEVHLGHLQIRQAVAAMSLTSGHTKLAMNRAGVVGVWRWCGWSTHSPPPRPLPRGLTGRTTH